MKGIRKPAFLTLCIVALVIIAVPATAQESQKNKPSGMRVRVKYWPQLGELRFMGIEKEPNASPERRAVGSNPYGIKYMEINGSLLTLGGEFKDWNEIADNLDRFLPEKLSKEYRPFREDARFECLAHRKALPTCTQIKKEEVKKK